MQRPADRRGSDIPPEKLRALVADLVADLADAHQIDDLMQRSIRNARRGLEAEQHTIVMLAPQEDTVARDYPAYREAGAP